VIPVIGAFALTRSGACVDLPGFGRCRSDMSDQEDAQVVRAVLLDAMTPAVIAPGANPIFHLMMPHFNAAVSSRIYPDEHRSTRGLDARHPAAWSRDHLGTPRRNPGPLGVTSGVVRPALNKLRIQPDRTRADGAVAAYLCNFLADHGEKPLKVLKAAGLVPETDADWHTADAVNALYTASQRYMPQTLNTDSEAASDADASDDQLAFEDSDSDAD
jgi:hypothetical protein